MGLSKRAPEGAQPAASCGRYKRESHFQNATSPKPCNRPNHKSAPHTTSQAAGNQGANQADPEQQQLVLLLLVFDPAPDSGRSGGLVDPKLVQYCRIHVPNVNRVFNDVVAIIVRLTELKASLNAGSCHPHCETTTVMIAAMIVGR